MTMHRSWTLPDRVWKPQSLPRVMGILNVTPDSFSDGGQHNEVEAAVSHAKQLVADGADLIDVGGESTRPGAVPVGLDEELRRTVPVIEQLTEQLEVPISIDTTKAEVARQAIAAGATIVNDISGLTFDSGMIAVCADSKAAVICMHIQGTPQTMQQEPTYDNVVDDIVRFFDQRVEQMVAGGVLMEHICLDPGIGFGKTAEHNLQILRNVKTLQSGGRPLLIGHSRKRFLSTVLGRAVEERTAGTVGVSIALAEQSVDLLRVHDVRAVTDALTAWQAISHIGNTSCP